MELPRQHRSPDSSAATHPFADRWQGVFAMELAGCPSFGVAPDGRVSPWGALMAERTGISRGDAEAAGPTVLLAHPADGPLFLDALQRTMDGRQLMELERSIRCADPIVSRRVRLTLLSQSDPGGGGAIVVSREPAGLHLQDVQRAEATHLRLMRCRAEAILQDLNQPLSVIRMAALNLLDKCGDETMDRLASLERLERLVARADEAIDIAARLARTLAAGQEAPRVWGKVADSADDGGEAGVASADVDTVAAARENGLER